MRMQVAVMEAAKMRHSPPVVPESHTGGKWRPEQRPTLHVAHAQLTRISPNWDEHVEELDTVEVLEGQHPPVGHTKGKWIPGTKMQRLEYKEEVVETCKVGKSRILVQYLLSSLEEQDKL
ncbi:unnamed protein product [Ceratitis capitata]|uniref:(Mediterranean fruit fly) hypothetical protein n=1 Tax=Ceratitis capitata TaxID=7213 RepID=A0A811US46_CERCA|nr:unnamed protein product [Ceratitis capitata]